MSGEINCLITKGLIPFVERSVGPEGVAALLRTAGRPREYLTAEYNRIPLVLADELARQAMQLMNEPDEDRWARRFADDFMDWKPSREERSWVGAYTMSLGSPRAVYADRISMIVQQDWARSEIVSMGRRRAVHRATPNPGVTVPRWLCAMARVVHERYPTNWQLPRARVTEYRCAARGDAYCEWEIRWRIRRSAPDSGRPPWSVWPPRPRSARFSRPPPRSRGRRRRRWPRCPHSAAAPSGMGSCSIIVAGIFSGS
jgi:hypothetical protein